MNKRLVVCCDGTWNDADTQTLNTNVSLLARAVHGSQDTDLQQVVLYIRGVGTSGLVIDTLVDGATGFGMDDNILSAYMFIAQNYVPGDELFVFGFSRGAFTARSLSGMIAACGILKRQRLGDLPNAWAYYHTSNMRNPAEFVGIYNTDSHMNAEIKFLGVWDTVGALGVPGMLARSFNQQQYAFHDTGPSKIIRHGCHALAIDEHRTDFVPTLWTGDLPADCIIEQVWFAGSHADVGGGYKTRALADIPLLWMAAKAQSDGLMLDWDCLPDHALLNPKAATHDSSQGVFAVDHFIPVYRQIAGKAFKVPLKGHMYSPAEPPINEKIHSSVLSRHGQLSQVCDVDDKGNCSLATYDPINLSPFWTDGVIVPATAIEP